MKKYSEMLNEIDKNIKFFGDDSDQKPQAPPVNENPAVDFSFACNGKGENEQLRVEMPQQSQRESNATPNQSKNEEFIQAMYKTTIKKHNEKE